MSQNWQSLELGEVVTLKRGYDLPASGRELSGLVPVVSSAGITGYHNVAMVKAPGVVTGRYGSVGNFFYVTEDFWPLNTTLYVQDFKGNEPHFVFYLLQTLNFAQHSGKTGVPGVNRNDLHRIQVPLPPRPEQRKIAQILGTWDAAIGRVEQLIAALQRRKQGLMQRLLVSNKETGQPAMRLPEFSKLWDSASFSDVFERVTRKNAVGNQNVLTASGQHGLISQTEFFNRSVASESLDGYYLLQRGEFAYNRSSMNGYPYGAIKQLTDYDAGVLSTLYLCFALISDQRDPRFYRHFFEAGGMNRGIYSIAQEGARNHGLLNVSVSDFFGLSVPVPELAEQQRLADLFDVVDQEIDLHQQKLAALRRQKQGLMQRLLTGQVRVKVEEAAGG